METEVITEFMQRTGASSHDALCCLKTWGWDMKRAIIDYNDTQEHNKKAYRMSNGKESEIIPTRNDEQFDKNVVEVKRRPLLVKSDSIDIADYRKLARGISRATDNINLVSLARTEIAKDFHSNSSPNDDTINWLDSPDFTFILPNIYNFPDDFRCFLEKDLIECSTISALEHSQHLNWWTVKGLCKKLWPLATTGDGNCLLHAASLGMWGFHDRKLTLRSALYSLLSKGKFRDALWRRWRFQQTRFNKLAGFVYSEIEWAKEWDELVTMSSPEPRNNSKSRRRISTSDKSLLPSSDSIDDAAVYESLEEIHIFALAHVLRRTIIVIADTVLKDLNGDAMAPITFGGVYLPFEIDPEECIRGPLLLAYDMAHFSALVPMETDNDTSPALIPLVSVNNILLPIQFCIDPGENFDWRNYDGSQGSWTLTEREQVALLKEYLDILYVPNIISPEEEHYEEFTDDEIDKRFLESEVTTAMVVALPTLPSDEVQVNNKNKAAKQLQSVARQFGSIGKNMGKKLKKNIGSITKIGSKSNQKNKQIISSTNSSHSFTSSRVLCARLRIQRYDFQEEMIRNYLECAKNRFFDLEKNRETQEIEIQHLEMLSIKDLKSTNTNSICRNFGCKNPIQSGDNNSNLCPECYDISILPNAAFLNNSALRYGTGKSKFYTYVDAKHHDSIKNLPPARKLNDLDRTLYLSNSTFYDDQLPDPTSHKIHKIDRSKSLTTELLPKKNFDDTNETPKLVSDHLKTIVEAPIIETSPCKVSGCIFYGTSATNFFCSKCYLAEGQTNCVTQDENAISRYATYTNGGGMSAIGKTNSKIMSDI